MSDMYLPPEAGVTYTVEGGQIRTNKAVMKKMSGSRLAGIMGISPFNTPFQVACDLLGLCRKDLDTPSTRAGRKLEEPIIAYADKTWSQYGQFIDARTVFGEHTGEHDKWASDFEDEYFEGRLDGVVSQDSEDYVLEIKTTIRPEHWLEHTEEPYNGVPPYYYWQVALYNQYVMRQPKAYVVMGAINDNTLKDPTSWVANERNTFIYCPQYDLEQVESQLEIFREWYDTYIKEGITPPYDPTNEGDVNMYNHLCNLGAGLEEIQEKLTRYVMLDKQIDEYDMRIKEMRTEAEKLKDSVKSYMIVHNLSSLDTIGGTCYGSLSTSRKNVWDEDKLNKLIEEASMSPSDFKRTNVTKSFTIKKHKV